MRDRLKIVGVFSIILIAHDSLDRLRKIEQYAQRNDAEVASSLFIRVDMDVTYLFLFIIKYARLLYVRL
jgi:hypothetical protein